MHSKVNTAQTHKCAPCYRKNHRICNSILNLNNIRKFKLYVRLFISINAVLLRTWYLVEVKINTEKGAAAPTMACVLGIPYSSSHFLSNLTTGGQDGRGHLIMSFNPCPVKLIASHYILYYRWFNFELFEKKSDYGYDHLPIYMRIAQT